MPHDKRFPEVPSPGLMFVAVLAAACLPGLGCGDLSSNNQPVGGTEATFHQSPPGVGVLARHRLKELQQIARDAGEAFPKGRRPDVHEVKRTDLGEGQSTMDATADSDRRRGRPRVMTVDRSNLAEQQSEVHLTDKLAVPYVVDMTLKEAIPLLKEHGFVPQGPRGTRWEDVVLAQDPPGNTEENPSFADPGATVEITVGIKVPRVIGMVVAEAQETLENRTLNPIPVGDAGTDGLVYDQDPPPHDDDGTPSICRTGTAVELDLGVEVPDVEHKPFSEAVKVLEDVDLRPDGPEQPLPDEVVEEQDPKAGTWVAHNTPVALGTSVPVPNVVGQPLATAKELLEAVGLTHSVPNVKARDVDVVRGQSPGGRGRARAEPLYVERGSRVRLEPVVAIVPEVVGLPISQAHERLSVREGFVVKYETGLLGSDSVTGQIPRAGSELPRGNVVRLEAKVPVPQFVGLAPEELSPEVLQDFQALPNLPPKEQNVIIAQLPPAGTLAEPRSRVAVALGAVVPNLIGMHPREADPLLRRIGLDAKIAANRVRAVEGALAEETVRIIAQSARAGQVVPRLHGVRVTTEQTVRVVTIPNVVGLSVADATSILTRAGLRYRTANSLALGGGGMGGAGAAQPPVVVQQNPAGATRVPVRDQVVVQLTVNTAGSYPDHQSKGFSGGGMGYF